MALRHHQRRTLLVGLTLIGLGLGGIAHANSDAHSLVNPVHISSAELANLRAQPLSLLAEFPEGGALMARYVAQAVAADPKVVPPILSIANDTSPEQAAAIGAGMVRGARALQAKQPGVARSIAAQVMQSSNARVKTTFMALGPKPLGSGEFAFTIPPLLPPASLGDSSSTNAFFNRESGLIVPNPIDDTIVLGDRNQPNAQAAPSDTDRADLAAVENDMRLRYVIVEASIAHSIAADAASSGAASTSPTE